MANPHPKSQPMQPMKEPMKPHGDKIDVDKTGAHKTGGQSGAAHGKQGSADTAEVGGAAYAPHDKEAEKLAESAGDERTPDKTIGQVKYAGQPTAQSTGDERTPDKTIGQIKYADRLQSKD